MTPTLDQIQREARAAIRATQGITGVDDVLRPNPEYEAARDWVEFRYQDNRRIPIAADPEHYMTTAADPRAMPVDEQIAEPVNSPPKPLRPKPFRPSF